MGTAKRERDVRRAGFMLRQLAELAAAMRPLRRPVLVQRVEAARLVENVDSPQFEQRLLMELNMRRSSGETFAALAADLNRRGVRGRYGARWYTASVRAFLHRRSVDLPVS